MGGQIAGTGIELAGVKRIVEQHSGRVDVESQVGEGSCFTVRLPLGNSQPDASSTEEQVEVFEFKMTR